MERAGLKQAADQKKKKEGFDKRACFQIEVQLGDQIYIDGLPGRVERSESVTTYLLTEHSNVLESPVTEWSRMLLFRTTGSNPLQSDTESTVTTDQHGVAILARLDRVIEIPRVSSDAEPIIELHNTIGQSEPSSKGSAS